MVPHDPALYYEVVGSRGSPIIVVHGGPGATHNYLRPEWDHLAVQYPVVYYDQRGCGRSERSGRYDWRDHVEDVNRLIEHVAPGKRVVLAGSSWGSLLALLYAVQYPDRVEALMLNGLPRWPRRALTLEDLPPRMGARADSILAGYPVGTLVEERTMPRQFSPDTPDGIPDRLKISQFCEDVFHGTNKSLSDAPPLEALALLRVPALVLRGEHAGSGDGSAELARVLPLARVVTIASSGHDPWFEQPGRFFAEVLNFLAGLGTPDERSPTIGRRGP
jgi:proline iminopeptidase